MSTDANLRPSPNDPLLDLLPQEKLATNEAREWVCDQISFARADFQAQLESRLDQPLSQKDRETARKQLTALADAGDRLLDSIRELDSMAVARLCRDGSKSLPGVPAVELPVWLTSQSHLPEGDILDRSAATVSWLAARAKEESILVAELETRGRGRPRDAAAVRLARRMHSLWVYLGGQIAPINRNDERSWRFLEFLQGVARVVDPQFSGEGAAKTILSEWRQTLA